VEFRKKSFVCYTYKQMILKSRDVINYYSKGATKS